MNCNWHCANGILSVAHAKFVIENVVRRMVYNMLMLISIYFELKCSLVMPTKFSKKCTNLHIYVICNFKNWIKFFNLPYCHLCNHLEWLPSEYLVYCIMSMAQVSKAACSETASVAAAHFYARYSRSAQCSKLMVKLLRYYISLGNPPPLFVF